MKARANPTKKKEVNYTEHTMSKNYLKYLSDLNKLSEHGNDNLEKVFNKYYKINKVCFPPVC